MRRVFARLAWLGGAVGNPAYLSLPQDKDVLVVSGDLAQELLHFQLSTDQADPRKTKQGEGSALSGILLIVGFGR